MGKPEKLIQLLKNLKTAKFKPHTEFLKTICMVEEFLETLFKIEITKTELSADEKITIGPLIAGLLNNTIGAWVSYSIGEINTEHFEDYKIPRSGLEFLFERYRELPDGKDNYLGEAFEYFKVAEDIEGWDEQFKNVSNSYDPDIFYKISDEPILNIQERERVPVTHWWWWC